MIVQTAERLATRFPTVPMDHVLVIVREEHVRFDGRPLRDFVPMLVERAAKEQLNRLVSASPPPGPDHDTIHPAEISPPTRRQSPQTHRTR
ncbi:MAG: three-helix bundle dimerization domain-containing protein [Mycobacteriaceae bacterium]